jgi:ribulose-5-phosphate 4-epimerase/fuculose-1-phosphate aldolase
VPSEFALREELVKGCQVLFATGAGGGGLAGHLSARLDDERILIKPRPASWRSLTAADLIVIDFQGSA